MKRRLAGAGIALSLALAAFASAAPPKGAVGDSADSSGSGPSVASATMLYNAGTVALERGALGPSVTFLLAASRIEPRASDIRANLASALIATARAGN